jgi:hypothetical protein
MIIEGYCRDCGQSFDAHWHQYPELPILEAVMHPYCKRCGSDDVSTHTDEDYDYYSDSGTDDPVEDDL